MKIFKLFIVLDMLKSNLRDYLYAREQEEKYILYFLNYLSAWLFFLVHNYASCLELF